MYALAMSQVVQTLQDNWAVIAQAPWAFLIVTIALIGIIWFILKSLYANRLEDRDSRLALKEAEIADY